jgi:transmembrane protein TMEM260 (protein O-mannosyltransferase)
MAEESQNPGAPSKDSTRLDRADWWTFGVTSALTFVGYLLTLTPEVTLDWSGILTAGAMYGGVGPPAGYPAWTIYSWLFIHVLPFSNPAWRVAIGSAVAGALACGLVALMVSRAGKIIFRETSTSQRLTIRERYWIRGVSGYAAGMALGFSNSFWSEALVADFVTFTVLLFTIIIYLLMRWMETGQRRLCWLAFFVCGLLLTDSQEMITAIPGIACAILLIDRKLGRDLALTLLPLVVLATSITQFSAWNSLSRSIDWPLLIAFAVASLAAVAVIVRTRNFGSEWKSALACAVFFLAGFAIYLYLPIASATNPPVNWTYSRTLDGFIHLVGRGQFEGVNPVDSPAIFMPELWRMLTQTGHQFGWFYVAFAALPFCFFSRLNKLGRIWMWSLLFISICVGPLLAALLNVGGDRQSQELVEMYFLPLRVLLALWTGLGFILVAMKTACLGRAQCLTPH